jgi:peptidoglycan/xylan/chitin deacetylase (PgdA/CDA1 family)
MKDCLKNPSLPFGNYGLRIKAVLTGDMRAFFTRVTAAPCSGEVPVFLFHAVKPAQLDIQLRYLQVNGYCTVDADALETIVRMSPRNERAIALTFDDATWTFWAYAFPLLKRYGFRAILFVIPGIVPDDLEHYPNLDDVWSGDCTMADVENRGRIQPLCTWRELRTMHDSGMVDIQSHSLFHSRVAISPRLVDCLYPGFDTDFYGNVNVPISSLDDPHYPSRKLRLGAPVFESAPRLVCRPRFKESPELVNAMTRYVKEHGDNAFFGRPNWRTELESIYRKRPCGSLGEYETSEEMEVAARRELFQSKEILEQRFPGKKVLHFAYPWFGGSDMADRLAAETGYRMVYYGKSINSRRTNNNRIPLRIRRISEKYVCRLPGEGRQPLWPFWVNGVRWFVGR